MTTDNAQPAAPKRDKVIELWALIEGEEILCVSMSEKKAAIWKKFPNVISGLWKLEKIEYLPRAAHDALKRENERLVAELEQSRISRQKIQKLLWNGCKVRSQRADQLAIELDAVKAERDAARYEENRLRGWVANAADWFKAFGHMDRCDSFRAALNHAPKGEG